MGTTQPRQAFRIIVTVNPTNLNRLALLLACAGLFVAGLMSAGHALNIIVPCGVEKGCEIITSHETAYWFDNAEAGTEGIPVAYFGFVTYVLLAALSGYRAIFGIASTRLLGKFALVLSGAGALLSLLLQYQAIEVVKVFCPWCLASMLIMAGSFVVQAWISQKEPTQTETKTLDLALALGLPLVAAVALGSATISQVKKSEEVQIGVVPIGNTFEQKMLREDALKLGPDTATIKIVEFSDLLCPACRRIFPEIEKLIEKANGKVQLIFRSFPLYEDERHKMALPAAFVMEYAREKGKGWEFVEEFYNVPPMEIEELSRVLEIAKSAGLDPDDANARMKDTDPAYLRVLADIKAANEVGIKQTPTFLVFAKGMRTEITTAPKLLKLLELPEYQRLIKGDGG